MATIEAETRTPIGDAAHLAWAARAELDEAAAVNSFNTQMFRKIKVKRGEYDVVADMFPGEYDPALRLGAVVDALTFCLNNTRALCVVNWRCAEKDCEELSRSPFSDFVSLGRALAQGERYGEKHPKCSQHRKGR